MKLGGFRKGPDHLAATRRIEGWTRTRFSLDEAATVMAAEIECEIPGCPPVETIVAFWTGEGTRYRFKIFKPVAGVEETDLPVRWLLPALVDDDLLGLECC